MTEQIAQIIMQLSWPGAVAFVFWVLHKEDVFSDIMGLFKQGGYDHEARLDELETNHVKHIKEDISDIESTQEEIANEVQDIKRRVIIIETKMEQ